MNDENDPAGLPLQDLVEWANWSYRIWKRQSAVDGGALPPPHILKLWQRVIQSSLNPPLPISANGNLKAGNAKIETWTTPKLAAPLVGKSAKRIRQLCGTDAFKSKQCGRPWLVELESLREYFNQSPKARRRHGKAV